MCTTHNVTVTVNFNGKLREGGGGTACLKIIIIRKTDLFMLGREIKKKEGEE